ncbi:MAG: caspase family protein [Peptococcaceae bacterium]
MTRNMYKQEYSNSWALIIGINNYKHVSKLMYARNDAEAISELIIQKFGFPQENVITLYDDDATRDTIMKAFMRFSKEDIKFDDRLFVFFAGHGHTIRGYRNDIGYLVPVDGNIEDLSSFIRWDELTRNSELIPAKHLFFIMDACFSGLAITRGLQSGSMRYLKDMLQRYSVQVLTAGKADEVVADANGPIAEHSIFTGHLIQAIEGNASISGGILTANSIMTYVFDKVSKDDYSNQTPHYGYFAGDGDFIFQAPILENLSTDEHIETDILVELPGRQESEETITDITEQVKEYISDEKYKIKLDNLVTKELRRFLDLTGNIKMPISAPVNHDNVIKRMKEYEKEYSNIQKIFITLAHWGSDSYDPIIKKILERTADNNTMESGAIAWLYFRWYPAVILMYSGGISAIASENYKNLRKIFAPNIVSAHTNNKTNPYLVSVVDAALELDRMNVFKNIPGHEKYYVPRSEYLFKLLQPQIDDVLFLGKSYESLFDRFEIFYALSYVNLSDKENGYWGPPGRFAWKYRRGYNTSIYTEILNEAEKFKDSWIPLKAGLFNGSYERFKEIAKGYQEFLLKGLNWF